MPFVVPLLPSRSQLQLNEGDPPPPGFRFYINDKVSKEASQIIFTLFIFWRSYTLMRILFSRARFFFFIFFSPSGFLVQLPPLRRLFRWATSLSLVTVGVVELLVLLALACQSSCVLTRISWFRLWASFLRIWLRSFSFTNYDSNDIWRFFGRCLDAGWSSNLWLLL